MRRIYLLKDLPLGLHETAYQFRETSIVFLPIDVSFYLENNLIKRILLQLTGLLQFVLDLFDNVLQPFSFHYPISQNSYNCLLGGRSAACLGAEGINFWLLM